MFVASARLTFRSVNRSGTPGYDGALQRHHLLPRQLLSSTALTRMFGRLDGTWPGMDDFRTNGLLLPSGEPAAVRLGLPLHRGPHRRYNQMVADRVGSIEALWSLTGSGRHADAGHQALFRLVLLQRALRSRLLGASPRRLMLNRRDPAFMAVDYSELDSLAESLWLATETVGQDLEPVRCASAAMAA